MSKYEMALVISAKLDDDTRAGVLDRAKGYIERSGGVIGKVQEWGKKRLAYEIQHQREGYYYFISFEAEAGSPAEIERHARIMDHVLRYLIVRQETEFIVEPPADEPEEHYSERPAAPAPAAEETPAQEAAEEAGQATETAEETVAEAAAQTEEAVDEVQETVEETDEPAGESATEAETSGEE